MNVKDECTSPIGFRPWEVKVKLDKNKCFEDKRIILRELMHLLGFPNEFSRCDRDEHVRIVNENIKSSKRD